MAKDNPDILVCPEGQGEGDEAHEEAEGEYPVVIARAALEEHPGPDGFPHGLSPGGEVEAGRVPVLVLRHDRAQGRAGVHGALQARPAHHGGRVITRRVLHKILIPETRLDNDLTSSLNIHSPKNVLVLVQVSAPLHLT